MNAAALNQFKKDAIGVFQRVFTGDTGTPGFITVAGRRYDAAISLSPITLSIPGEGLVEHRGLTAYVLKTDLVNEPGIGSHVTHEGTSYIVNSTSGRKESDVHWKLICIEEHQHA